MTAFASWSHNLLLVVLPFAADPVPEPEDVKPGWIAFVVVMALVAASILLWLSMRKQLGRIRVPREGGEADTAEDVEDAGDGPSNPTDPRS